MNPETHTVTFKRQGHNGITRFLFQRVIECEREIFKFRSQDRFPRNRRIPYYAGSTVLMGEIAVVEMEYAGGDYAMAAYDVDPSILKAADINTLPGRNSVGLKMTISGILDYLDDDRIQSNPTAAQKFMTLTAEQSRQIQITNCSVS